MHIKEILEQIRREQGSFSPSQKQVASYILENYEQIPFLSITELAEKIGVSHYTIIKFCNHLGYSRFSEFKKELSEYASDLIIYKKLSKNEPSKDSLQGYNRFFANELDDSLRALQNTLGNPANQENLPRFLDMLNSARYIYVTGGRASSHFSNLLAGFLRYLGLKIYELTPGCEDFLDRSAMIEPSDLVIAVSFPRYTARVIRSLEELHQKGIPIVLITDNGLSPAYPYAALTFFCETASSSYLQCYTGCLALIGVLCRAAGYSRKSLAAGHMQQFEQDLIDHGIFYSL